ncbi:hypothetical protein BpHYR1_003804 [Brachionus plicatilis]|uniref:Uncharacterized protein n=1 Tax=Brachionus plicatilis TaxID=10195 RepID=A0A3M7RNS2_BRAPC|nr:hypothetical protein BpHYR1_003804 [Brachionus plicatilis]
MSKVNISTLFDIYRSEKYYDNRAIWVQKLQTKDNLINLSQKIVESFNRQKKVCVLRVNML